MDFKLVAQRLSSIEGDIIILKGFSARTIQSLSTQYTLLDEYIYENNKISLEKISASQLLQSFLLANTPSICSIESFIALCNNVSNLEVLGKKIIVLENNLCSLYHNPSSTEIPDFESNDFENSSSTNLQYTPFYSYAVKENGKTYIQYIDNYSILNPSISTIPLVEPIPPILIPFNHESKVLLTQYDLEKILAQISEEGFIEIPGELFVDERIIDLRSLGILYSLCHFYGKPIKIYSSKTNKQIAPRPKLKEILNKIWGYDTFRTLLFYKNPIQNRELFEIPQNVIMETVVRQSEKAYKNQISEMNNILLTAPTGAGKSLLFQLPAIYLAETYNLLTIVVSPLVALMDDQVEGLEGYTGIATLNSNKSASAKEQIIDEIKKENINILYISPELLLSYSINSFIGTRRIGLFVVDEAHTVTTWGRDFRVDYLFLGDHIRKIKKVVGYTFPIFALTATAVLDPSGRNDMVNNTIQSLHMDPCIKLIGNVRRNNIAFQINDSHITTNYEEKRRDLTIQRIKEAINANIKTLIYFPFKKTIDSIAFGDEISDVRQFLGVYHAGLFPNIKTQNALDFKNGQRPVMCATKAYGMGIDISDIKEVYHHAPSGSLSDYIQEIGRIARDQSITGIAKIDFCPKDFRYSRKLHGLSTIKPYQLREVLSKLMELFKLNGEKRNMLISASDFSYIFPLADTDTLDQNLKSSLLLISNDLLNKLQFHSIIIRPKSIFSKCFLSVSDSEANLFLRKYRKYLRKETKNIFLFDADAFWMDLHSNLSFPNFKYKLAEGKIFTDIKVSIKIKVTLSLRTDLKDTFQALHTFFDLSESFLLHMATSHHRLNITEMKEKLPCTWDNEKKERFVESFKMVYASPHGADIAYCRLYSTSNEHGVEKSFQFIQGGYEYMKTKYISLFKEFVNTEHFVSYVDNNNRLLSLCEFMNSVGVASYQKEGGEQPMIFVRINNPGYLNHLIRKKNYENTILNNIYDMHAYSERVFSYFFTTPMSDKERWDFIENYFLGMPEDKLLK